MDEKQQDNLNENPQPDDTPVNEGEQNTANTDAHSSQGAQAENRAEHTREEKQQKKKKNEQSEDVKRLEKQLTEQKERLLRTAAEYDNYRKRTEKEKSQSVEYGVSSAVSAILTALDNLERAAAAETTDTKYKQGVEMTLKQFQSALEGLGINEIPALGQPFDPTVHSAVAQLEQDGAESGTVTAVLQKGYRFSSGRVVRHAMVAVQP